MTAAEVRVARERIGGGIVTTPLVPALALPGDLPCALHLAEAGANVLEVAHTRAFADVPVRHVDIAMQLETRSEEHRESIMERLRAEGYTVRQSA